MARAKGAAAIRNMWAQAFADSTHRLTWKAQAADVVDGCEIGYSTGRWRSHTFKRDTAGSYMAVWRKSAAGTWRVLLDTAWY